MYLTEPNHSGSATAGFVSSPSEEDPYQYQHGFGNHHVSEAIPGALPRSGTNIPQKCPYGLFPEHLNGTPFVSSRETVSNVWMYRIRPGAAHRPVAAAESPPHLESCFLPLNPNVDFTPLSHTWGPILESKNKFPGRENQEKVMFVQGLRTVGGHGDPTLKEGLAVHLYAFNADMQREAFVNHDGDMLLVPWKGALDVQTELGYLRVRPGDIAVIPAGFRFAVRLASRSADAVVDDWDQVEAGGYVLEVFGSHFALPELGPIGANGLAHVRDFQHPVAAFDVDPPCAAAPAPAPSPPSPDSPTATTPSSSSPPQPPPPPTNTPNTPYRITLKLSGKLTTYTQPHTPFDVIAWHGRYAPYKYTLSHFAHLSPNTDQLDPSAFTVLTAPSKHAGVSLVDLCVFGPKWAVAADTVRLPYYHRTVATEMMGVISGTYRGSVRPLEVGGLSFESAYMPHGESYEAWRREVGRALGAEFADGFLGFMFHIPAHVGLTRWAREEHPDIRLDRVDFWDGFRGDFVDHIAEVNQRLAEARMPMLAVPFSGEDGGQQTNGVNGNGTNGTNGTNGVNGHS